MTEKHNPQKPVPVYRHCTPSSSDADYQLSYSRAQQLVRNGDAIRINHNKALRLRLGFEIARPDSLQCPFPSLALRRYSAHLVAEIGEIKAAEGYSPKITARLRLGMQINKLRLDHEGLNGCRCWYTPAELELNDALGMR
jgi:hypothetical protein